MIILTAFYTANLTAFLTLSEFRLPIASLEELGNKQYPIVAISGTVLEESANNVCRAPLFVTYLSYNFHYLFFTVFIRISVILEIRRSLLYLEKIGEKICQRKWFTNFRKMGNGT